MPVFAQGIKKQTRFGKQTGLGVPKSGAGGQILRRKTAIFTASRDMFTNDEIVSHQQSTGVTYGLKKAAGKLDGLISPGTYALLIAGGLRKDFSATASMTGLSITIAGAGPYTLTRSAGSFLTSGLKAGDVVRLTAGSFTAANLNNNLLVISTTALVATVATLNGSTLTTEGPISSATLAVPGKKSLVPLTGHTDDFFTFEEWYADLARSEVFTDTKVNQLKFGLPATGNATFEVDLIALNRVLGSSQNFTTPTVETTTDVLSALNGAVYLNGSSVGNVTGAEVMVDCGVKPVSAVLGSNFSPDMDRGRIQVSGSFTGIFDSAAVQALYDGESPASLILVITVNPDNNSDFFSIVLGKIKITGDAPDDGEKGIIRSYPFTAEINGAGGAALEWDQTIVTIQDSQA